MQGRLKIILGYAAGVGKTFKMLEEGQRLRDEGADVVIGYFEPHGRKDTIAKTDGLEFVPRRVVEYRERKFEEMDTEAILARRPEICLVDEFPHTNVPGSSRAKRWEDVLVLLEAGIGVITTMNIQHLESLNDQIKEITNVQVRETIPDWVLNRAEDVEIADLTPRALINRLDRGVVYAPDKAQRAKENFFKETSLAALREMALRQTAHEIDVKQDDDVPAPTQSAGGDVPERILIHVTDAPATAALIRRGRRVADYLKVDCLAVCVLPEAGINALPARSREALEQHLAFARKLHIETRVLEGSDDAATLVDFAHTNAITQIYLAKPAPPRIPFFGRKQMAMRVIRLAKDIQVIVVADRGKRTGLS